MSNSKSCLVTRLNNYIEIDDGLEELLGGLEKSEKNYPKGTQIYSGGDKSENLYVVKNGWFISYTDLPDGERLVVKVHHPGDIIGFQGIAFDYQTVDLRSCTDACLCPFDKDDLDIIFSSAPKLTALLFTLALREQIVSIDRLRAVSRMNAQARIAHFLLDLLYRLRGTNSSMTNEFRLPLTQTEIGDAVGLTNVSVSRNMTIMEDTDKIERTKSGVKILEEQQLIELCSFEDRYSNIDTSWFPEG